MHSIPCLVCLEARADKKSKVRFRDMSLHRRNWSDSLLRRNKRRVHVLGIQRKERHMAGAKEPWYCKHSNLGKAFHQFYDTCQNETNLDNKTRELLQLALASVFRCPRCTREHLRGALNSGASKQEVSETLLIAAQEGAGTQLSRLKE
ncbi:MAG: hypothetical protein GF401_09185 [Chitinivibrionales bacterium]|nr:hypothetical protein [Chitinivibrionales bacterium]